MFAGLLDASIARLMALHADVVRQPAGQTGRVNNARVQFSRYRARRAAFSNVQFAGPVAIFAANADFVERWIAI